MEWEEGGRKDYYWDDDINYFDVEVEVGKRGWMDVDGDDDGWWWWMMRKRNQWWCKCWWCWWWWWKDDYYYNCDYYSQANHRVTEPKVSPSRWRGEAEEARWIIRKEWKKEEPAHTAGNQEKRKRLIKDVLKKGGQGKIILKTVAWDQPNSIPSMNLFLNTFPQPISIKISFLG